MDNPYSPDTITVTPAEPAQVDKLNDFLAEAGQGRPLASADRTAGSRLVVSVAGGAAEKVVDTLRPAGFDTNRDPLMRTGTLMLAGKDIGHGFGLSILVHNPVVATPEWKEPGDGLRRPVVALLDTAVGNHTWLVPPAATEADPFLLATAVPGLRAWSPQIATPMAADAVLRGHATFIAGLIRMTAPSARILPLRVMADDGTAQESTVIDALTWLAGYVDSGRPVDVVCMAFGRRPGQTSDLQEFEAAVRALAERGVQLVASAGNSHTHEKVYPAAFDKVTAVGAGSGGQHATFSNHGDWVDCYRDGVGVLGPVPPGQWGRWSGTSFAAAALVGDLARPRAVPHG
jgi:hypothetical protein